MELLTEQELALVHSPELFEESYDYIYESEEEALYEDYLNTLNENFEIEALSNFLIENFETEEIDYIFALTEALQTYLVENFEFSNENEINEAILLLDEESVIEILEDFEYGEGITDATFEDILESVQSIYDSSDVIEESILGNFRDTVRGVIGLPPVDPKNIKSGKVYRGAKPGTSKKNEIKVRGAVGRRRSVTEDYEFLMEQAAVLSSLKVASMLAEVNLKQLAGTAGRVAGVGYGLAKGLAKVGRHDIGRFKDIRSKIKKDTGSAIKGDIGALAATLYKGGEAYRVPNRSNIPQTTSEPMNTGFTRKKGKSVKTRNLLYKPGITTGGELKTKTGSIGDAKQSVFGKSSGPGTGRGYSDIAAKLNMKNREREAKAVKRNERNNLTTVSRGQFKLK